VFLELEAVENVKVVTCYKIISGILPGRLRNITTYLI
jgi:hypothetical protein